MAVSLAELAKLVGGDVLGEGSTAINGAATLSAARPGEISFVSSAEKAQRIAQTAASAVVVPRTLAPEKLPAIQVDDVAAAFAAIVRYFRPPRPERRSGVSPLAVVSPTARFGDDVDIHPGATVGDDVEIGAGSTIHAGARLMAGCKLGPNVTIYPNAVLYENTIVGPRTTIHANAVIGAFGFGYSLVAGRHQPSAQLGHVELGADVEIGAGSTIDRGTYGATVIGEGTKIDNLVMIAHNCRLGRHNLICSQVGIAGSTTTGDYVTMAGKAGVRDHVHIGDRAVLGAQAGVPNDVPADAFVFGSPARPEREQKLIFAAIAKLPEMRQEFKALRAAVARLEAEAGGKAGQNAAA
ncbi:MAG TPA: UDP-3-O-(3-hydroxymyristoyl)glucosamine N-acyltransferase [Pirellulales bacterium]|nr:UDP-3-O-(3-hydroxymyristoyl)glucosamine N-acyltransferase [Pirellulales bacterium]